MLDLAPFDSLALLALQIVAWSNVCVAAAFLLVLLTAIACAASDCLRDRRAARRRFISREAAAQDRGIGHEAVQTPDNTVPSERPPRPRKVTLAARTFTLAVAAVSIVTLAAAPALAQSGHDLFQQALVKERADGDLRGAIGLYERIVREFSTDRSLSARALVQMGQCYEKLGSTEAESAYRRVVREFGDQQAPVAEARTRLAALERAARAAEAVSITTRLVWLETSGEWNSITPDGKYAVYDDYTGNLALRDVATGESRPLTDDATWSEAWSAKVSPDGMRVAYAWDIQDQPGQVRVVSTEGFDPRVLYAEEACAVWPLAWSSDGRNLLANRACEPAADGVRPFQLLLLSVQDSAAHLLKDFGRGPFPGTRVLSPDDRYVAYDIPVEADGGMRDIWVLALDGSADAPLIEHPANDQLLGWVPGTEDVLFLSDRNGTWDAWAVRVANGRANGAPRLLRRNMGQVDPIGFSADGRLFYSAYTRWWSTSVAPFDAATGRVDEESAAAILGSNFSARWSPDGQYLAFVQEQHGPGGPGSGYKRPLRIRHVATGEERELGSLQQMQRPQWSPDGRSILINAWNEADEGDAYNGGLYLIDAASGEATRVLDIPEGTVWWYGLGAVWSADGRAIIYSVYNEDANEGRMVWRDLASGTERELYRDSCLTTRDLDLAPDGHHLLFGIKDSLWGSSAGIDAGGRLMVMDLESGDTRELIAFRNSEGVGSVQWTPDGRGVLYATMKVNQGSNVWRVAAGGGEPEKLWSFAEGHFGGWFTVGPDGRQIAYTVYSQEEEVWVMENLREVLEGKD
jgi:Tol biopolymer transport system component